MAEMTLAKHDHMIKAVCTENLIALRGRARLRKLIG